MQIAFAGDRPISLRILKFIQSRGIEPVAYLNKENLNDIKDIELDYIICIHFHPIIPERVLKIPKHGVLNLHPSYLPWNRGWHTPTWAMIEGTPIGATLHFMDEGIDTGDIVHQRRLDIRPDDTAHKLYQRILDLEYQVFTEAWPKLVSFNYQRQKQNLIGNGTFHKKSDLASIQGFLNGDNVLYSTIKTLAALTTNDIREAAYFDYGGYRYRVQVNIERN